MLATLTNDSSNDQVDKKGRLLLHTTPPPTIPSPQSTSPSKTPPMSSHNPILHSRYKRTSVSKPLYASLSDKQVRLLRIVPGTRRGEFTAQMFETGLTSASTEYEYSILTLVPQPESQQANKGRQGSVGSGGNDDEDLTYFPILSLGGGEHQIEIPMKVKRALERVVEGRWDCFHSTRYSHETRRMWRSKPNGDGDSERHDDLQRDGTAERDLRQGGGEVGVKQYDDEDGESDTGEGEDFCLWIQDICVDRTDVSDQQQQDKLFGRICEGAEEIVLAEVPDSMRGKIEIERLENLGCVKSVSDVYHIEAVQETFEAMRWEQTVERAWRGGWR